MTGRRRGAVLLAVVVGLGACGSGGGAPELAADGAWARPTPPGAADGVVYLTVTSDRDDAIVGATVADSVAGEVQMHETSVEEGGASHSSHGGGGGGEVMAMGETTSVDVAADAPAVFEPGGDHLMLVDLTQPLVRGERFTVTLRLASDRTLPVDVVVADNPPT